MKFSEMKYKRPDIEEIKNLFSDVRQRLAGASSFEEADKAFLEADRLSERVSSMGTICYIRHQIDTRDEFYDLETAFFDENGPVFEEFGQEILKALTGSKFREDFIKKYGALLFENIEINLKTFSPEIIPELQKENALVTEYGKLIASAKIPFEGKTYTLSQLTPLKQDPDDSRRRAAWEAEAGFYAANREKLDSIYAELTGLRTGMAKKLGFENYVGLGYCRMLRNSYKKEDIEVFRRSVVEDIVPLASKIYRAQAERLGVKYPLSFADAALQFRSGNPKPAGGPEDILSAGKDFYRTLSGETAEFIDFMFENDLFDVLSRDGKAVGGFCTEINEYKSPFIFANFNGTAHDVEVMTHEAGHAFAAYTARDIVPSDYKSPTLESCEIHSMSMEFFGHSFAERFFGKDALKFEYSHLSGAITFIPYGTMVDHFQHSVYENPGMSETDRHAEWLRLMGIYMPWIDPEDLPFYCEGRGWQRQIHIYQSPFYYIDYCLAQSVALQFWAFMRKDQKAAWAAYMRLVGLAGTKKFTELVAAAGLESPFGGEGFKRVCREAEDWLDRVDHKLLV